MFEGQPKGLYALALANTGERFGFYTMLAIFTLFVQAKFGYTPAQTSAIYSTFMMFVYLMPLFGGMLADHFGYGKMVTTGIFVMFFGYLLLSVPMNGVVGVAMMFSALALIACGTGLFKGNLQVMVGNLYDKAEYASKRDGGFTIFYMAINIGALFAPTAATKITNWMLGRVGFTYDATIPALAHKFLETPGQMTADNTAALHTAFQTQAHSTGDIATFCHQYIESLSTAYNIGFSVACFSLVVSILIYYIFRRTFRDADYNSKTAAAKGEAVEELSHAETKQRLVALFLVFFVVIFFWMAFQQNGLTLTWFARDYTVHSVTGADRFGFDVTNLVAAILMIYGIFAVFQNKTGKGKGIGAGLIVLPLLYIIFNMSNTPDNVAVLPQIFQHFNPCFVVALTPVSLAIFGYLAKKGIEPSAPRKIAYGMLVAAVAYTLMSFASKGLPTPDALSAGTMPNLVSPNWLISTYLILTFGELLLSPIGISFVSKVAPPKYKGAMMGCWFVATAIGNQLVGVIGYLWGGIPLWSVWLVLVVLCIISAFFMFCMMKRLEKVA
jgi:POT family proton-dependent oligopeptide transporter